MEAIQEIPIAPVPTSVGKQAETKRTNMMQDDDNSFQDWMLRLSGSENEAPASADKVARRKTAVDKEIEEKPGEGDETMRQSDEIGGRNERKSSAEAGNPSMSTWPYAAAPSDASLQANKDAQAETSPAHPVQQKDGAQKWRKVIRPDVLHEAFGSAKRAKGEQASSEKQSHHPVGSEIAASETGKGKTVPSAETAAGVSRPNGAADPNAGQSSGRIGSAAAELLSGQWKTTSKSLLSVLSSAVTRQKTGAAAATTVRGSQAHESATERHNPELAALLTKLAAALSTGDTAKMTKLLKLLQQADGSPAAGADKLGLSATPMDNGRTIGKQKTDAAVRTGSLTDTSLSTDMKTGSPAADRSHPASGLRSAEEASPINEGAVNKKEAQRSDRAPRSTGPDSSVGRVVLTDFPDGRMSKVALLLAYGGPDASESASSGDLSRQVSDRLAAWMNKSSFSFPPAGEQRLTMTLYPEQLGQLTVTVSQTADGIVAKLIASTAEARDLLESGLNQLKQDFVSRGLPVSQIDVSRQWQVPYNDPGSEAAPNHNGSSQDGQDRPDGHNDDQKQQRASSIDTVREDEDGRSFSEWLTGGMSEWLKLQV